jgi:hypothetical protein
MLGNWVVKIYETVDPIPLNERQVMVYKQGSNYRSYPYKLLKDMIEQGRLHEIQGWTFTDNAILESKVNKVIKQLERQY